MTVAKEGKKNICQIINIGNFNRFKSTFRDIPKDINRHRDFDKSLKTPKVNAQDAYVCDRRFGTLPMLFRNQEVVDVSQ